MRSTSIIILMLTRSIFYGQSSIEIGSQVWMTENLDVMTFQNGDPIPQAQSNEEWEQAGFNQRPAWCYVTVRENNKDKQLVKYKKLYNSFAVNDPRGLVPKGWRISTTKDWNELRQFLASNNEPLSSILSVSEWEQSTGTNVHGLNIKPGGWRDVGCGGVGVSVTYWCEQAENSNVRDKSTYTYSLVQYENGEVGMHEGTTSWIMGHYVRCVKIQ